MEIKFDSVKPNLLVESNNFSNTIYINVPREELVSFAKDVDDVVRKNIGTLGVKESDIGTVAEDSVKKKSKKYVPLSDYIKVLGNLEQNQYLTSPSYKLLGAGDYLIDAWTLEESKDIDTTEMKKTIGFLKNLKEHLNYIKDAFGSVIKEESAKKHLKKRLSKLEKGLAERYGHLWVISGLAPVKSLKSFYDNTIVVGRIDFGSRKEKDKIIAETREEVVEKLKKYSGVRLSLDVPRLMGQAYKLHLTGHKLIAEYGDVLDNPDWKKRMILLDN